MDQSGAIRAAMSVYGRYVGVPIWSREAEKREEASKRLREAVAEATWATGVRKGNGGAAADLFSARPKEGGREVAEGGTKSPESPGVCLYLLVSC